MKTPKNILLLFALIWSVLSLESNAQDTGIPDTVDLVATVVPNAQLNQLQLQLELWVFNDEFVGGASMEFGWDNPNLTMDSAFLSPLINSLSQLVILFEDNSIDTTNLFRRFLFFSPEPPAITSKFPVEPEASLLLPGNSSGRRLWATYYFTLSSWSDTSVINIDTVGFEEGFSTYEFTTGFVPFFPVWTGGLIVVDATFNNSPVLDSIGNQSVNENDTLSFLVTATDVDNDIILMTIVNTDLPAGYTYQEVDLRVTTSIYEFKWVPTFDDSGTYTVTFVADDTLAADSQTILITVFNVNQLPVLAPTPDTTINEVQLLILSFTGFDPDGGNVFYSSFGLPAGASFTDSANGQASLVWTPTFDQAGTYNITIFLTEQTSSSTSGPTVEDNFTITVNEVNSLPVIDSLPDTLTISEGDSLLFFVNSTDFEDFCLNLQMTSPDLPLEAVFSKINSECGESGNFFWQTDFDDAGIYRANFTVTDDSGGVGTDSIIIIVNNVNRPPELDTIGNKSVNENQFMEFDITAFDPDEEGLSFSTSTLPAGADFFSTSGGWTFSWTPDFTQSGNYSVTFYVSDGLATDSEVVSITVFNVNQQPVLNPINDTTIDEGQSLVLSLSGFDPDSTAVFFFVFGEPLGSELVDNGNGTATFSWTPTFFDAGTYDITFQLFGIGKEGDDQLVRITVNEVNILPQIDSLPDTLTIDESDSLSFFVSATDFEDFCLNIVLTGPDLPGTVSFENFGECGEFMKFFWQTDFDDAGIYTANFTVTDDSGGVDQDSVIIIVRNVNQPPQWEFNKGEFTNEGVNLIFSIAAIDGDNTIPSISVLGLLPIGARFTDNGDGSGTFDWTPDFNQSGEHSVTLVATDDFLAADTTTIFILVNEAGDAELSVKNSSCLQCSPPQNFIDIIVTELSFSIEFNNQIDRFSLDGNVNITSIRDPGGGRSQSFGFFYDEYSRLLFVSPLSESEQFEPVDTITVFLTTGILDLSGAPLDSSYSLVYLTGPVVFPGDADNNGVVDERDILSLGLYWNLTGPAREVEVETDPLEFAPSPGHFQVLSEKWEPNTAAYSDADGSGIINADDICGVSLNFGLSSQPAQKNNGDMSAMKQLDNSVMQQMYNALIECPNSAGKSHLIEFLENAINNQSVVLPTEVELYQNYPNPFNPSTSIEFYLPEQQQVSLDIYNILGQKVITLLDGQIEAGFKTVYWAGTDGRGEAVASGIYFYILKTDDRKISKRMMLLK